MDSNVHSVIWRPKMKRKLAVDDKFWIKNKTYFTHGWFHDNALETLICAKPVLPLHVIAKIISYYDTWYGQRESRICELIQKIHGYKNKLY
jgi:hypothetical protein